MGAIMTRAINKMKAHQHDFKTTRMFKRLVNSTRRCLRCEPTRSMLVGRPFGGQPPERG
jgi:hypothetical protein